MKPVVSIIVPMYNAEQTIEKCLDSIINQTYEKLEIILVDNGSDDNTINLAREYCEKDSRMMLISENKKGVSNARNKGIAISKGDYLSFVDADDALEHTGIDKQVEIIEEANADIAFYDYYRVENDKKEIVKEVIPYGTYVSNEKHIIYKEMCEGKYFASVWRALYRASLVKGMTSFRNIKYAEDLLFNIESIENSETIVISDVASYYYIDNEYSALKTLQYSLQNTIDLISEAEKIYKLNNNADVLECFKRIVDAGCLRILNGTIKYKQFKKWIYRINISVYNEDKLIKNIQSKNIFRLYLIYCCKKIKNKLRRG